MLLLYCHTSKRASSKQVGNLQAQAARNAQRTAHKPCNDSAAFVMHAAAIKRS
jgi:hypothetical protein